MPKIMAHLRVDLLACARKILQEEGYETLSMRRVADSCHIALGTIYNYFPSKEVLSASVLLEDWQSALQQLHSRCAQAASALQAMRFVYDCVADFCIVYEKVWSQYTVHAGLMPYIRSRHRMLIDHLSAEIEPVLEQFGCLFCSQLSTFLAESLLNAATEPSVTFNDLIPIMQKLFEQSAEP